ncbi:MAG TPA: sulfite exporter TauE/SafE family protein [Stellaceae bacterium]|nr:sulfite exporter TauE/SafE family protein [Stellaceae bacterium]
MELLHPLHLAPALTALCGGDAAGFLGIAAGLLSLGLVGGAVHCAPMCGPFVLMQLAEPAGGVGVQRVASSALPGYQLGRLTTYIALGAAFGGLGGTVMQAIHWRPIAGSLLAIAAFSFLAQALKSSGLSSASVPFAGIGAQLVTPLLGPIERLLRMRRLRLTGYALGLVLGFLPCGLLYTALIAAAAAGGAVAGGLAMAAFALGTMPALMTLGLLGAGALRRWREPLRRIATPLFLFNALLLGGLALRSTL